MKVRVHNEDIAMLVDTGANVTLLKNNCQSVKDLMQTSDIRPVNTSLVTATGESTLFHGQTNVTLSIRSKCYDHNVLVAIISNDGILGLDFQVKHACNVNLAEETLNIGHEGERVPCHRFVSNALSTCFTLRLPKTLRSPQEVRKLYLAPQLMVIYQVTLHSLKMPKNLRKEQDCW